MNMRLSLKISAVVPIVIGLSLLAILGTRDQSLMAASREAGHSTHTKKATPANPLPPKDLAVPFHVGETLNYRVAWAAFATAASLQVTVPERRNLFGWNTWHFRAALHTQSPVRTLFTVDDEFDSYTDASTLETRQYESYQNELGRKVDQLLHFIPAGQKSRAPGPHVIVLPGTRDPSEFSTPGMSIGSRRRNFMRL